MNFFDITRFNLTSIQLEPERVNISRMLEQIGFEFHPILAEKDLQLETEIKPNVEILCDPDKLARVFDNLLRNAVNYSYAGTTILLSMDYQPIEDAVRICVEIMEKPFHRTSWSAFLTSFSVWTVPGDRPPEAPVWVLPSQKKSWNFTTEPLLPRARMKASALQ